MLALEALVIAIVVAGARGSRALDAWLPNDWTEPTRPYEELKAEFGGRAWLAVVAGYATMMISGLAWTGAFMAAAELVRHPPPEAVFVLRPARGMFVIPGIFLGIATWGLLDARIDRRIFEERYSDGWFVAFRITFPKAPPSAATKLFFKNRRLAIFMIPKVAALGLVASCLTLDTYAYVTPSEIVVNPFLGFQERHHSFADIESVNTRLIGMHERKDLECRILFKDGSTFSNAEPPSRLNNDEAEALAAYVTERMAAPRTRQSDRWTVPTPQ